MKLYIHPASPNARRARIAARLSNVEVEEIVLDMAAGESRAPEYLAINPMGKVPSLVRDNGEALLESHAIAAYLASDTSALPEGRAAEVHQWQFFDAAHFAPPLGTLTFQYMFAPKPDEGVVAESLSQFRRFAAVLESALEERVFLLGDEPTIADSGLVASLTYAEACRVPLADTPRLAAWRERLEALPAFASTAPATM